MSFELFTKHSYLFLLFILMFGRVIVPSLQIPEAQSQVVTCPRSPSYKMAASGLDLGLL